MRHEEYIRFQALRRLGKLEDLPVIRLAKQKDAWVRPKNLRDAQEPPVIRFQQQDLEGSLCWPGQNPFRLRVVMPPGCDPDGYFELKKGISPTGCGSFSARPDRGALRPPARSGRGP